jgi:hypothetical protein
VLLCVHACSNSCCAHIIVCGAVIGCTLAAFTSPLHPCSQVMDCHAPLLEQTDLLCNRGTHNGVAIHSCPWQLDRLLASAYKPTCSRQQWITALDKGEGSTRAVKGTCNTCPCAAQSSGVQAAYKARSSGRFQRGRSGLKGTCSWMRHPIMLQPWSKTLMPFAGGRRLRIMKGGCGRQCLSPYYVASATPHALLLPAVTWRLGRFQRNALWCTM